MRLSTRRVIPSRLMGQNFVFPNVVPCNCERNSTKMPPKKAVREAEKRLRETEQRLREELEDLC